MGLLTLALGEALLGCPGAARPGGDEGDTAPAAGDTGDGADTAVAGGCPEGEDCVVTLDELEDWYTLPADEERGVPWSAVSGATVATLDECALYVVREAPQGLEALTGATGVTRIDVTSDNCTRVFPLGEAELYGVTCDWRATQEDGDRGGVRFAVLDAEGGAEVASYESRGYPLGAGGGDYDGDGISDVAFIDAQSNGYGAYEQAIVDVLDGRTNGDLGDTDRLARVWLEGAVSWGAAACLSTNRPSLPGFGDIDGDGVDDLAVTLTCYNDDLGSEASLIWLGPLASESTIAAPDVANDHLEVTGAADWDGDGRAEILALVDSGGEDCRAVVLPAEPGAPALDGDGAILSGAASGCGGAAYVAPVGLAGMEGEPEFLWQRTDYVDYEVHELTYLVSRVSRAGVVELGEATPRLDAADARGVGAPLVLGPGAGGAAYLVVASWDGVGSSYDLGFWDGSGFDPLPGG